MREVINRIRQFLVKDLIIAALIVGFLALNGMPFINSRGVSTVLFFVVILVLWKFRRTNLFLLSTARVLQMVDLVGIIVSLIIYGSYVPKLPDLQSLKLPLFMASQFILAGFMYYYLSIWSKLFKEGKEIDLSRYKKPLIIISITIGVIMLFGEDITKWLFEW